LKLLINYPNLSSSICPQISSSKSLDYIGMTALLNATLISFNVQIHENICSLSIFLSRYVLLLSHKNYVTKILYCSIRNNSVLVNVLPFGQKHPATRFYITDHSAMWIVTVQSVTFFHNNMCYCSISKIFLQ